jgi:hypothetical protein
MPIPLQILLRDNIFEFFAANACIYSIKSTPPLIRTQPLSLFTQLGGLFSGFQSARISREQIPSMQ